MQTLPLLYYCTSYLSEVKGRSFRRFYLWRTRIPAPQQLEQTQERQYLLHLLQLHLQMVILLPQVIRASLPFLNRRRSGFQFSMQVLFGPLHQLSESDNPAFDLPQPPSSSQAGQSQEKVCSNNCDDHSLTSEGGGQKRTEDYRTSSSAVQPSDKGESRLQFAKVCRFSTNSGQDKPSVQRFSPALLRPLYREWKPRT